jgi:hypothetical protein
MNTNELTNLLGSTEKHLEAIRAKFYEVVKVQLHPNIEGFKSPEQFGIYKTTGGEALSTMGKDFVPMQQIEFLDSIIHTVFECGADLDLETLEFREFKGGRQIEFSIQMQPLSFVNRAGRFDETQNKLTFSTSYDGSKSNTIALYTLRQICTNGMIGWGMESVLKGKNTAGGKNKILTYCDEVVKIVAETKKYNERLQQLDLVKVGKAEIEAFKLKLLGYNKESLAKSEKPETKKQNILDRINESIELEFERTGETLFGLLQGVTHYTNHVANNSTTITDEEYIRFYQGAKLNNEAQRLVFAELN